MNNNKKLIYLYPITAPEIRTRIATLKDKCGGLDGTSVQTIKTILQYIIEPLKCISKLCIQSSSRPNELKTSEVIPISEAGKRNDPSNYRPISLVSNIVTIFEKIIHGRLSNFVQKHKTLSDKQYGFVKKIKALNMH